MTQAGNDTIGNNANSYMGQPATPGRPDDHTSPQQCAGDIASYLQQAQQESRAGMSRVEDQAAQELFGRIAGLLDPAIKSLYDYRGGGSGAPIMSR